MFLLMTSNHKAIYKLALHEVTYPEKNRKIYLEMKKIEQSKWNQNDTKKSLKYSCIRDVYAHSKFFLYTH